MTGKLFNLDRHTNKASQNVLNHNKFKFSFFYKTIPNYNRYNFAMSNWLNPKKTKLHSMAAHNSF